mmetsp:Transcript_74713/g.134636  ORF Transcript_74713/g.134636 Transcript_74713/m.134636 type:complete len:204 (+) Transcript_74713:215-826(+)
MPERLLQAAIRAAVRSCQGGTSGKPAWEPLSKALLGMRPFRPFRWSWSGADIFWGTPTKAILARQMHGLAALGQRSIQLGKTSGTFLDGLPKLRRSLRVVFRRQRANCLKRCAATFAASLMHIKSTLHLLAKIPPHFAIAGVPVQRTVEMAGSQVLEKLFGVLTLTACKERCLPFSQMLTLSARISLTTWASVAPWMQAWESS